MKRKTRWDVTPNPLATVVNDQIQPIVRRMHRASHVIELLGPHGFDPDHRTDGFKTARDSECFRVALSLIFDSKDFDVRKRLPGPIARHLRKMAEHLNKAADFIERIPDARDLSKLSK